MESNLGRLEIKFHMVGMEWLDLNTRVGGSLLRKCMVGVVDFLMALSTNEEGVEGVYIASTQNPTVTHIFDQSRSDRSENSVRPKVQI